MDGAHRTRCGKQQQLKLTLQGQMQMNEWQRCLKTSRTYVTDSEAKEKETQRIREGHFEYFNSSILQASEWVKRTMRLQTTAS